MSIVPSFAATLVLLALSICPAAPFDAQPSVCVVQYQSASNTFSETLIHDPASPAVLYAYVCTKNYGSCKSLNINLLPSGAQDCYRNVNAPELTVGSTTINTFFSPSSSSLWTSKCPSIYYQINLCQADGTNDREDVTLDELFPGTTTSSVLRNAAPPPDRNLCPELRCNQAGTSEYSWWRTVDSFSVSTAGEHTFTLRGMMQDSIIHTHSNDGNVFSFNLAASTCPPGKVLTSGTCVNCVVGRYKTTTSPNPCVACRSGLYGIVEGATTIVEGCTDCPSGRYGSGTGMTSEEFCVLCAAGKYCTADSSDNVLLCHAGRHGTRGESTPNCGNVCPAGYWCSNGTAIGSENACGAHPTCTESISICYCPAGSIQPLHASPGQYTYGSSPDGTTDKHTSVASCSPGTYCTHGVQHLCPAGTYCEEYSRVSAGPVCTAGFFCPPGSSSRQQQSCSDGNTCDKYCPEATSTPLIAAAGFYTTPVDAPCSERSGAVPCPAGSWCVAGVKRPKLEWKDESATCGGDLPHQLLLNVDEGTPNHGMLNINVLEHREDGTSVVVGVNGLTVSTSICVDNSVHSTPFELVAGVNANALPVLRTKSSENGGFVSYTACRNYQLTLQASDAAASFSVECTVSIVINDINNAPTWLSSTLVDRTVRERSSKGTTVTLSSSGQPAVSLVALDDDVGQELTYEVISTFPASREGVLSVTRCGGVITVQSPTLLYPEVVKLCVRACDDPSFFGSESGSALCSPSTTECTNITVRTENVNDPPTFSSVTACSSISPCVVPEGTLEGVAVVGASMSGTAEDNDGDTLQWHLSSDSEGGHMFTIGLEDGILYAGATATDYETVRSYVLELIVTDNSNEQNNCLSSWCESLGKCCAIRQIRIDVSDINDLPVWPDGFASTVFTVVENSVVGTTIGEPFLATDQDHSSTVTYTVNDKNRDAGLTDRVNVNNLASGTSSLGQLQVNFLIDYEDVAFFLIDLTATDNGAPTPAFAVVEDIRVQVVDVNEPSVVQNAVLSVGENAATGATILDMSSEIIYVDPDEATFGVDLSYSLLASPPYSTYFHVSSSGNLLFLVSALDFETLTANPIILQFRGTQRDAPTLRTNIATIHVTITDENEAPICDDIHIMLDEYVNGGTTVDSIVVTTLVATDPDNNIDAWTLTTNWKSTFALSTPGGVLTVTTASNLNYEDTPIINLIVRVTDEGSKLHFLDDNVFLLPFFFSDSLVFSLLPLFPFENFFLFYQKIAHCILLQLFLYRPT